MSDTSWVSAVFARAGLLGKDDITAIVVQIGSRWDGRVGTWDKCSHFYCLLVQKAASLLAKRGSNLTSFGGVLHMTTDMAAQGQVTPHVCGEVSVSGSTRPSPSCVHIIVSATLVFQEMMVPIPTYFAWQRKGNQALVQDCYALPGT